MIMMQARLVLPLLLSILQVVAADRAEVVTITSSEATPSVVLPNKVAASAGVIELEDASSAGQRQRHRAKTPIHLDPIALPNGPLTEKSGHGSPRDHRALRVQLGANRRLQTSQTESRSGTPTGPGNVFREFDSAEDDESTDDDDGTDDGGIVGNRSVPNTGSSNRSNVGGAGGGDYGGGPGGGNGNGGAGGAGGGNGNGAGGNAGNGNGNGGAENAGQYDQHDEPEFDCSQLGGSLSAHCETATDLPIDNSAPTMSPSLVEEPSFPKPPPNHIDVKASIALSHPYEQLSSEHMAFLHMLIDDVTTQLLDEESPFEVLLQRDDNDQSVRKLSSTSGDGQQEKVSRLTHYATSVKPKVTLERSQRDQNGEMITTNYYFLDVKIIYTVWWMDGRILQRPAYLRDIDHICGSIMNYNLNHDHYTERLWQAEQFQEAVGHEGFATDGEDSIQILDTARPGKEEESVRAIDTSSSSVTSSSNDSSLDDSSSSSGSSNDRGFFNDRVFNSHLNPNKKWAAREWSGLAILLFAILFGVCLPILSTFLRKRHDHDQTWGQTAYLTEDGLADVLNVGWGYSQENVPVENNNPDPREENPQLYLQVFNKGKVGYAEDNSVLQGGLHVVHTGVGVVSNSSPTPTTLPPSNSSGQTLERH